MNPDLIRLAIVAVVGVHGIGHALGWIPAWGIATFEGMSSRSWLLDGLLGERASAALGGALWFAPMVGFGVAIVALLAGHPAWRTAAVTAAVLSLVAVALFWDALPLSSRIGCVVVDLAVIGGLLAGWAESEPIGF